MPGSCREGSDRRRPRRVRRAGCSTGWRYPYRCSAGPARRRRPASARRARQPGASARRARRAPGRSPTGEREPSWRWDAAPTVVRAAPEPSWRSGAAPTAVPVVRAVPVARAVSRRRVWACLARVPYPGGRQRHRRGRRQARRWRTAPSPAVPAGHGGSVVRSLDSSCNSLRGCAPENPRALRSVYQTAYMASRNHLFFMPALPSLVITGFPHRINPATSVDRANTPRRPFALSVPGADGTIRGVRGGTRRRRTR